MKQLSERSILVIAIFALSVVVALQIYRIDRLKSQLKDQAETIERYANALFERSRDLYNAKQTHK